MKLPFLLLAAAFLVSTTPGTARAGFDNLQGQYKGFYTSTASSSFASATTTGRTVAKIRGLGSGSHRGRLILTGLNSHTGSTYKATIEFKGSGVCTATSVVPNVIDVAGTGTWTANASGRKVKYTVTVATAYGTYTATGTITGTGDYLAAKITFTGSVLSPTLASSGSYIYEGSR